MGAEVIPDQVNFALRAVARQHIVLQKGEDRFAGLACLRQSHTLASMWSESAEQLNRLGLVITVGEESLPEVPFRPRRPRFRPAADGDRALRS